MRSSKSVYVLLCAIWYHLCNLKKREGGVSVTFSSKVAGVY